MSATRVPSLLRLRTLSIELAATIVRRGGLEALARHTYARGKVGILVYHDPSPERLEAHLRFLSTRYRFVSLTELTDALARQDWSSIPAGALVVTFDDGHRGNLRLTDVLLRFGVRPTIYLCPGIVRGDGRFWFQLAGVDPEPLKLLPTRERGQAVGAAAREPGERHALTPDEVERLPALVELGSHSVSHPILPLCSDDEARDEIVESRRQVAELAGRPCIHFSFPNGDYGAREIALVREAGYASGRTTDIGWNSLGSDRFRLKIVSLADHASTNVLAAHLAGLFALRRAIPSRRRRRQLAARSGERRLTNSAGRLR